MKQKARDINITYFISQFALMILQACQVQLFHMFQIQRLVIVVTLYVGHSFVLVFSPRSFVFHLLSFLLMVVLHLLFYRYAVQIKLSPGYYDLFRYLIPFVVVIGFCFIVLLASLVSCRGRIGIAFISPTLLCETRQVSVPNMQPY